MKNRVLALLAALGVLCFVGGLVWATLRNEKATSAASNQFVPTAVVSDVLSDGRIEVQVFALGNRIVRLEIQFGPQSDAAAMVGIRPEVILGMARMHMDGFVPPLEALGSNSWRSSFKVPMAGRWIVSVGFGEEFVEAEFDVE